MSRAGLWTMDPAQAYRAVAGALYSVGPAVLFGLRLWAAVCLALYVAFWLELDSAYWAGTTAAIVCQPSLGASLRKGSFRMIGTVLGAVAIVVLTAYFPQNRVGFLVGLAVWGAMCGFIATLLRNFASYAAALAGYTAVILAGDLLGATGGANGEIFTLAVTRVSEICIGIVCASVVLAGTDFGQARERLAAQLAAISAEIAGGLSGMLAAPVGQETRSIRRDLIRRVIAVDPIIDEAIGETSELRFRLGGLHAALEGLFAALSGWRMVANHLELLPNNQQQQEADAVLRGLPWEVRFAPLGGGAPRWTADPRRLRRNCAAAVRALVALPADSPSLRLLADGTAEALGGISCALNGLALLSNSDKGAQQNRVARFRVPDLLPAFVNAARVFIVMGVFELFWIVTAWPSGTSAMTWSAIFVILFSPTADQAYTNARIRLLGICLTAALAAIFKFAVLPGSETFIGLAISIGLVLTPAGALSALSWQVAIFGSIASWFVPLVAPENQISYDTLQFYNSTLAIVAGAGAAALAFRLLPPLSPGLRTRRLLALSLRDLRRLTTGPIPGTVNEWEGRVYSRLSVLPEQAEPLQRAQLMAALSVGTEIIRLRRVAHRFDQDAELDTAFDALARGDSSVAIDRLARLDQRLAALPNTRPGARARLRARSSILAMSEALARHAAYFDSGAAR
jgi:uncharacterized membrane protein YccC